jgi:hypothetical protein
MHFLGAAIITYGDPWPQPILYSTYVFDLCIAAMIVADGDE